MPEKKPNVKSEPMSSLRLMLAQQDVGPLRKSHFGPQDVVDPLKIEAVSQDQKWRERQLPTSNEPLAKHNLLSAITGDEEPFYTNTLADPNAIADIGGMAGTMEKVGGKIARKALPKLPEIDPRAYEHVKAGGLRLYSRLTDAMAKAPQTMTPDKVRSIAKTGTSAEEVSLRKLEEFLSGRQSMDKISRDEVMGHLEANPLELNVQRRVKKPYNATEEGIRVQNYIDEGERLQDDPIDIEELSANYVQRTDAVNQYRHELDTRYGHAWDPEQLEEGDRLRLNELLESEAEAGREYRQAEATNRDEFYAGESQRFEPDPKTEPKYAWMQTEGPRENYGETLINYPVDRSGYPDRARFPEFTEEGFNASEDLKNPQVYHAPHWRETPNNLVHTRHNERFLDPTHDEATAYLGKAGFEPTSDGVHYEDNQGTPVFAQYNTPGWDTLPADIRTNYDRWRNAGPPIKGRLTEELQSDIHQHGRKIGYKGDPMPEVHTVEHKGPEYQPTPWEAYVDAWPHIGAMSGKTAEDAAQNLAAHIEGARPPQMPFKDTYHELAMKADLLDVANNPELEWYGISDADTASRLQGHTKELGSTQGLRPGMVEYYDKRHPTALKKLLSPFGGTVEHDTLPGKEIFGQTSIGSPGERFERGGKVDYAMKVNLDDQHVASVIPNGRSAFSVPHDEGFNIARAAAESHPKGSRLPAEGFWKAKLDPEMKRLIAKRGFPAMALLLALQEANASAADTGTTTTVPLPDGSSAVGLTQAEADKLKAAIGQGRWRQAVPSRKWRAAPAKRKR